MAVYRSVDALLPRDKDNEPIQVLTPSTITNAAVVVTSTASALPTGAQIVEVSTSTDSYILFGTSGSTVANTTGQFHPKGISLYTVPTGSTHLCHIRDTADGRISITKMV